MEILTQEHLDTLLKKHNLELKDKDLSNLDIINCHLFNIKLIRCNLSNARIEDCSVEELEMIDCTCNGMILSNSSFSQSYLVNCFLSNIVVTELFSIFIDFDECITTNVRISNSKFYSTNLGDGKIESVFVEQTIFDDVLFYKLSLRGGIFVESEIIKADIRNSSLFNIILQNCEKVEIAPSETVYQNILKI